jgi:hypothetical protein
MVTHNAVLILSVGVTAITLSVAPATTPASIPRPGESDPFSSDNELLMVERNLTAALAVVPFKPLELVTAPYEY